MERLTLQSQKRFNNSNITMRQTQGIDPTKLIRSSPVVDCSGFWLSSNDPCPHDVTHPLGLPWHRDQVEKPGHCDSTALKASKAEGVLSLQILTLLKSA